MEKLERGLARYRKFVIPAAVVCGALVLGAQAGFYVKLDSTASPQTVVDAVTLVLLVPLCLIVGGLIVSHQPRNAIGWLLMLPAVSALLDGPIKSRLSGLQAAPTNPSLELTLIVILANAGWLLLILPIVFIVLLFPNGSPPSRRWRWVVWFGIGLIVFFVIFAAGAREIGPDSWTYGVNWMIRNPVGFLPTDLVNVLVGPWALGLGIFTILAVVSLIVRYRHAGMVEKQQIKWLLYAATLFAVSYVPKLLASGEVEGLPGELSSLLVAFSVLAIPVAIGISILRYRLFDIDIIIRRTLTYGLVTALLGLVFFGSIILLQQVFAGLTGSGQNEIVTVLSTLAIAALFVPLRKWVQNAIDKRFNRKKYDAQKVLADFANTVRDETDLEKLTARLMQVVDETMEPKSVSLWLKQEGRPKQARPTGVFERKG